jgi:hypothetical protein
MHAFQQHKLKATSTSTTALNWHLFGQAFCRKTGKLENQERSVGVEASQLVADQCVMAQ